MLLFCNVICVIPGIMIDAMMIGAVISTVMDSLCMCPPKTFLKKEDLYAVKSRRLTFAAL